MCDSDAQSSIARKQAVKRDRACSGSSAARVPSSSEYANAPMRSKRNSLQKSTSSECCSGVSPGNPEMNVVRRTRPGMRSRSLRKSASVCARGGRFIASSARLLMCCSGMSMYLQTFGFAAISSMRSSEK